MTMAFCHLPLAWSKLGRYLPQVSGSRLNLLQFSHRLAKPLNISSFSTQTADKDSQECTKYHFAPLSTRSIVHISGLETYDFMQGLVTNDIRHLLDNGSTPVSQNCIYSFMLNTSGRILFDLLIYNFFHRNDELFIEVDSQLATHFVALLKRYKIRRKIAIKLNETAKVFTVYPDKPKDAQKLQIQGPFEGNHLLAQDPRNYHFGYRLLTFGSEQADVPQILSTANTSFKDASFTESDTEKYRIFRYQNGIAEGSVDFPPETMFPFEANAELLNGVSFQKGCYVGQELTARTFHTGVVRKRLVPFELLVDSSTELPDTLPLQNVVETVDGVAEEEDAPKKVMGRYKVNFGRFGLASLKHGEIFTEGKTESTNLKLDKSGHRMRVWQPFWWPDKKF